MRTDVLCEGRPVLFLHNPKTGGKSLRSVLGVTRLSHAPPSQRLNRKWWMNSFTVVAVRDPFERFLSGYFDHVLKPTPNGLTRIYGDCVKTCSRWQYLHILQQNPKFGGPQRQWTDYPCPAKPRADLVLRFEEIDRWCDQLRATGVQIGDRTLPHRDASARAGADLCAELRLTTAGIYDLEQAVRARFLDNALAFGYPLVPVSPADPSTSTAYSALSPA